MNRDTTLKLTMRSSGFILSDSSILMKLNEFFTWCAVFPVCWLKNPNRCLESWYVGAPMLLAVGLSGTPSMCILGSPYNLGGLEPAGPSCGRVSSVSDDFLSNAVVSVLLNLWDLWLLFYKPGLEERKKSSVCSLRC